ncbi:hypothetical protein LshimejAT787_1800670 [Lyophyllum shimeji]|uniref:F-box domain-containing protein n=1 Tax=Lyophyllum shimeji TaxID=47721 RepID=A0A9P3PXA3_LYOSH|nr:hypothetical protein LshimejAT787_1800670 [Lyophyllum shimeji]
MVPPRSSSVTLPIELQFAVIDSLRSNKRALRICALVCSYWRLKSHSHAFWTVVLTWRSVLPLHNLIQNEFSAAAIISSVKAVHVRGSPVAFRYWDLDKISALSDVLASFSSAGNIDTLRLQLLTRAAVPFGVPALDHFRLSTITRLELLETHFDSEAELVAFLGNFRGLRHLVLQSVRCINRSASFSRTIPPGSYALSLQVGNKMIRACWDSDTAEDAVLPSDLVNLVELVNLGWQHIPNLLQTLGASLHHLQLDSQSYDAILLAHRHQLVWTHTTGLKQLTLGTARRLPPLLSWVPDILAEIPMTEPPTLNILKIAFPTSRQLHENRPFLLHIAEVLSRPQFRLLQVIQFVVPVRVDRELENRIEWTIREALATWSEKGVLVFDFARRGQFPGCGSAHPGKDAADFTPDTGESPVVHQSLTPDQLRQEAEAAGEATVDTPTTTTQQRSTGTSSLMMR